MDDFVLGLDIGGTNIRGATVSKNGKIISITKIPSIPFEKNLFYCISEQIDKNFSNKTVNIGIGSAGPLDPITGFLHSPENLTCGEYPLKEKVIIEFNAQKVEVRNDLDAIGLGYYHFGESKMQGFQEQALAIIAPGTGLGASMLLDGKPYFGGVNSGYLACEHGKAPYFGETVAEIKAKIGHSWEEFTAGKGVISIYKNLFGESKDPEIKKIIEVADNRDKPWIIENFARAKKNPNFIKRFSEFKDKKIDQICLSAYENVGKHLGYSIASFVTNFNPNLVILEGSISKAFDLMKNAITNAFQKSVFPAHQKTPIVLGKLINAGVLGAASLVF
ncbi:MAG: ROK family protein [Candidatus Lokiarchaeota archaeon]|nr:ROK family protein [Candidatus Lokiarchaeota archaeon]